jgi:hypothetical protein
MFLTARDKTSTELFLSPLHLVSRVNRFAAFRVVKMSAPVISNARDDDNGVMGQTTTVQRTSIFTGPVVTDIVTIEYY